MLMTFERRRESVADNSDEPGVPVADAIEYLRDELEEALGKGAGRSVQFGVSKVTLTVNVVAGKTKEAGGKIRWWVIEAGGSGKWSHEVTQNLVLTLHPERVHPDGRRTPLDVGAEDTEAPVPDSGNT
jgi:hypothetical protein